MKLWKNICEDLGCRAVQTCANPVDLENAAKKTGVDTSENDLSKARGFLIGVGGDHGTTSNASLPQVDVNSY